MKKLSIASILLFITLVANSTETFAEEGETPLTAKVESSVTLTEAEGVSLLKIADASSLNFGTKALEVNALTLTDINSPSITITDIRGDASGWSLSVALGEFVAKKKTESEAQRTLAGVRLFYPTVKMETTSTAISPEERRPEVLATDSGFTSEANAKKGIVIDSSITATSKTLINAKNGKGNGQWTATYNQLGEEENTVKLYVPAGNQSGAYTATLTYTLSDKPASQSVQ